MIEHLPILLAANWDDVLKGAGALLVVAYWIFSALSDAKKPAPAQPKARPQPVEPPPGAPRPVNAGAQGGPAVAKPVEDNVRAEVEEFLRRVRQQGEGERRPANAAAERRRPRIEVLVDDTGQEVAMPPNRSVIAPERQARPPLRRTETAPAAQRPEVAPTISPTAEPVPLAKRHLAESAVAEHARHLGEQIGQADDRMEAHLHRKFDHNLGKLSAREATPAEQVVVALAATPAEGIAALLATPQGMQQAIILSEIMRRPTDRW